MIAFPTNPPPQVNDTYTASGKTWKWTGVVWQLQPKTTDSITEGSNNLFFTEARVASAPAVTALESRASDIESAATSLESRVSTTESSIGSFQSDIGPRMSNAEALITQAYGQIVNLDTTTSDINSQIWALQSENLPGRLATAESDIDSLESNLQSEIDRATAAESALGTRIDGVESAATELTTRVTDVENAFGSFQSDIGNRMGLAELNINLIYENFPGRLATAESDIDSLESNLQSEIDRATASEQTLTQNVSGLQGNVSNLFDNSIAHEWRIMELENRASLAQNGLASLGSNLETERGRIDAILSASDADKDSFAEIVSLINSVDTENDNAFAGYVLSNNAALQAEVDRATAAEQTLTTSIASLVSGAAASVRDTVLTGLSTASNAVITASDSVLAAFGKLQAQVSAVLSSLNTHTADTANPHSVTKAQVGLGNADNTSDADKPVSSAQQAALDGKQIKTVYSDTAPAHAAGLEWVDTTDLRSYRSYNGAWVEIDRA